MIKITSLDKATNKEEALKLFNDKKCTDCIAKKEGNHENIAIYLIKYYKICWHRSMLHSVCEFHAARHPLKDVSHTIIKLSEKDIFYLRIT